jgi:hypothetical protein
MRRLGSGTKRKCAGETGKRKARRKFRRKEASSFADFYVVAEATTSKEFRAQVKPRTLHKSKGSGTPANFNRDWSESGAARKGLATRLLTTTRRPRQPLDAA